ncbi:MAG TPA: benzoate-CoA ligase family protein [Xanthobacteraceae bacterium]|nr:benzoate-CoA ligase family protein [Xanthobacteraceae bacterium]
MAETMPDVAVYNAASDLIDRNLAAGRGDKPAFIDRQRRLTYRELARETARAANHLQRLGLRREDRVALVLLDTVDFPVLFLGAIRAGIVPVPLNTLLTAEQYAYILADTRARVAFVSEPLLPVLEQARGKLPGIEFIVVGATKATPHRKLSLGDESDTFATVATHPDEPAFWLYSSGSTGMPKGTKHIHTSMMATAELFAQQTLGMHEGDVVYSAAKLFFAYGLGNALSFPMSVGATAVLFDGRPTPEAIFEILRREQPTIFCSGPTSFAAILADPKCTREAGSRRLRLCTSAGEALPEHLGLAWKERFGCDIIDGVGSTEMLHIFLSNRPGDIRYGTAGRAVPGYALRLLDEQGREVGDDEVGELFVHGPSAAEGYWNQREKSRSTFGGAWTRTGDKFVRDRDGRYTYCGRADDMFKVSGVWVSPFEVESALISHPAILEAAVIPHADADGLLKPKAYIVLKNNAAPPGEALDAALREHVKTTVGPWKYPRWIEVLDSLPKTATGKIQRFKLREMDMQGK